MMPASARRTCAYLELVGSCVSPELRARFAVAIAGACSTLWLPAPRVRYYFSPPTAAERAAAAARKEELLTAYSGIRAEAGTLALADSLRHEVWVSADLAPELAMYVAAHEARHLALGDEDQADGFARRFVAQWRLVAEHPARLS